MGTHPRDFNKQKGGLIAMPQKTRNPTSGVRVQGFGMENSFPAISAPENSTSLPEIQKKWLSARFGLAADRARLTAELAWGGAVSAATRKRQLKATSEAVQRVVDADDRFFRRFPWRSHRVRYAATAEIKANAAVMNLDAINSQPGKRWFGIVHEVAPGFCTRLFVQNDADIDPEMDEESARRIYEWLARTGSPRAQEMDRKLRRFLEERGAS